MATRNRITLRTLLPAIALVVGACGAPPSTSGSPGGAVVSSPAGSEPAAPSGSFDPGSMTLDFSTDAIVSAAAQENADRASERALSNMTGYLGPEAPALAAALDQKAADELWKLVDLATAATPNAVLASVPVPRLTRPVDPAAVPPPGMGLLGPWATSLIIVSAPLSWEKASSESHHSVDKVELGPNKGTVTTDISTTVTPSGSRLVVDVTSKQVGEVSDANGRLIFRINSVGHAHVEVQACPDAQGTATTAMEFSANEVYFASSDTGRGGGSWQEDDKADAKIFSNDEANLDHVTFDLKAGIANKGGTRAAGAAQSDLTAYTIDLVGTMALGQDGLGKAGPGTFNASNVTRAQVEDAYRATEKFLGIVVWISARAAEKFWRSGKCIQVVVDPEGGDVGANSATTVNATVRHKFEGIELNKPVEATMTGVKSIEPAGKRQPAPATFTYTAGPKPKDTGNVTFKSVSNRGIGETTVKFIVGGGWKTENSDPTGLAIKGQKCGGLDGAWRIDGKLGSSDLDVTSTYVVSINGTTLAGTYTFKSVTITKTPYGNIVTTGTGNGPASIVAQADGTLKMTLAAITLTSTAVGAGTSETLSLPIPAIDFTWTSGGPCPE